MHAHLSQPGRRRHFICPARQPPLTVPPVDQSNRRRSLENIPVGFHNAQTILRVHSRRRSLLPLQGQRVLRLSGPFEFHINRSAVRFDVGGIARREDRIAVDRID